MRSATLPAPAIGRHFARFCEHLHGRARRRRQHRGAGHVRPPALRSGRRHRLPGAPGDRGIGHRRRSPRSSPTSRCVRPSSPTRTTPSWPSTGSATGSRSAARPFPDLGRDGDLVELPFWHLAEERRAVWARRGETIEVARGRRDVMSLPPIRRAAAEAAAASALDDRAEGGHADAVQPACSWRTCSSTASAAPATTW